MSDGLVHSPDCRIGTSHSIPEKCRGADFKPIIHLTRIPEPEVIREPADNSEEGQKALEAAAQAEQDAQGDVDAAWDPHGDPDSTRGVHDSWYSA